MPIHSCRASVTLASLVIALAKHAAAQTLEPVSQPEEIVVGEALVIEPVGKTGRIPFPIDPIQAEVAAGRWRAPREGEKVTKAGGGEATWEKSKADEKGEFSGPALRGGYLFATVDTQRAQVMVLEAAGHGMVYVNGEPRVGDPYANGIVRVPVKLKQGTNELLFAAGRGSLRAKLVAARGDAEFNALDVTAPDIVRPPDRSGDEWFETLAIPVLNCTERPLTGLSVRSEPGGWVDTRIAAIPPLSVRKVAVTVRGAWPDGPGPAPVKLTLLQGERSLAEMELKLDVRVEGEAFKETFTSAIDGSTQYYAVLPAADAGPYGAPEPRALVLSVHGASVEAIAQARSYAPKTWCDIVAPTNRRPFGFDWEDWGRLDALEVLDHASRRISHTSRGGSSSRFGGEADVRTRVYLTGHSMGGHGTWQLGATYPDRFAAIAPSAGWLSFWTYMAGPRPEATTPIAKIFRRAANPSDTLLLLRNCANQGVYILHGDKDDNVPVEQARMAKGLLTEFHRDFTVFEQPDAGHWWDNSDAPGAACVDWPPIFDLFARRVIPDWRTVRQVDFVTLNPGISSQYGWAEIFGQERALEPSEIHLQLDPAARSVTGTTQNVSRLAITLPIAIRGAIAVELDQQRFGDLSYPAGDSPKEGVRLGTLYFERIDGRWLRVERKWPASDKGPHRYGQFKDAFRNRVMFVYGTQGDAAENAANYNKARFDAEVFWYRGNGSIDVIADREFDPQASVDRNVVLYGNSNTNSAWDALMGRGPLGVERDRVRIGAHEFAGGGLGCIAIRPRPDSDIACVACVAGTDVAGMRGLERLPYFLSGVAYPDFVVCGDVSARGMDGVVATGYFGLDWSVERGEIATAGEDSRPVAP